MYSNTSGSQNTANGVNALHFNTTGSYNIAEGYLAGQNIITGSSNIDIGNLGLASDTNIIRIGSGQTQAFIAGVITGNGAGLTNVSITGPSAFSASGNAANGYQALQTDTTGIDNSANGYQSLYNNTTGSYNTANGYASLYFNTFGINNSSSGSGAMYSNTSGSQNTANGVNALHFNTTGSYNIAEGYLAGQNIITGSSNIDIGNLGLASDTNIIRIGSGQTQAFIAGQIIGDGSGLTNINVGQLPSVVLTNNSSGAVLNGTFTGDGSGLGNLSAYQLSSGTISDTLLSPNVALLGASQTFQGQNIFNSNVGIGNANPTNKLVVVNARCDGSSWINASDRNLKQGFASVDAQAVLARVIAMPVQTWSYKAQPEQKHLGPVAQDFHAAFGLGQDDTSISTVDEGGVALAAIQGLNQKLNEKNAEIEALKQSVSELKQMVQTLVGKK